MKLVGLTPLLVRYRLSFNIKPKTKADLVLTFTVMNKTTLKRVTGFTLLELLVAIAIIGLISTIALAVVTNSRENARLAGAKQFAAQVHRSFGATEKLRWTFDNDSGSSVLDESGNNQTGSIVGSGHLFVPSVLAGKALDVSGLGNYVNYDIPDALEWGGSFTITLWAQSDAPITSYTVNSGIFASSNISSAPLFNGTFSIEVPGPSTTTTCSIVLFRRGTAPEVNACFGNNIDIQSWHYYTVVHKGTTPDNTKLYLDGSLVRDISPSIFMFETLPHFKAYRAGANRPATPTVFNGKLDEVNVYNAELSQAQIQKFYAEGLPKHKIVEK